SGTRTWNRVNSSTCDQRQERLALSDCPIQNEGSGDFAFAGVVGSGSVLQPSTWIKAIDGGKDQDWYHNSCTHTNYEWESWWRLDLQQKYKVNMVVVYGRSDCCKERMNGLEVRVGDSPNNHNPACGTITDYNITTTPFCCNGMEGRYISAVIPGRSEYLHLCEVEVYGEPAGPASINIARSGEATQSSTLIYLAISSVASNAIDGGKDQKWSHGSCSHTNYDWEPWWRLDLKQKQSVYVIKVYGRSDSFLWRLQDLEVRIGDSPDNNNPLCGMITNYTNPITTFCCNGLAGRYVSAVIPGRSERLTLCEIEVYNGTMTENDVCW
ncbi:PREDICTED: uncharacterized protein LOC108798053, partial [Nanorana parkeri]|uniref:uncharacterized protein LOC108798053 n=1 Tax=Nanorana parkeri TaxID=125878 RepID=UPI000854E6FE